MENASKALLIAGAILICILLIGVGMLVYQSAQGTISEAVSQMSSQEKDMFNQQFEQYAGSRVNGSNVRALLQKIRNNNNTNADTYDKQVTVTSTAIQGSTVALTNVKTADTVGKSKILDDKAINEINTAGSYTVVCTDTNTDGLIDKVDISKNGSN